MTQDGRANARTKSRSSPWKGRETWAAVAFSAVLIAACYGYSLRLPFYFDDLPVLTWLSGQDLRDIWTTSSENAYYRPLTFTLYKLGSLLPKGAEQVVLHGINLLLHWANAILLAQVVRLVDGPRSRGAKAALASMLYAVFPFMFRAVPWVTAMPHFLALTLVLGAVYAALRAERENRPGWWAISLLATALAPFAHENGFICGAIVGGTLLIQHGIRSGRRIAAIVLGGLLNAGALALRSQLPGTGSFDPDGLNSLYENAMFFFQGLTYPLGPLAGWLVRRQGWHDFTLVQVATALLALILAWLGRRRREWRWLARPLWWWAWASIPAAVRFRYGGLVNSPRFYILGSVGVVMLWADAIAGLSSLARPTWGRRLVWGVLAGTILASNVAFLWGQRQVHLSLMGVYGQILDAAEVEGNAPLGFVNIPAWLAPKDQTYALSKDGAIGLPLYTNVWEFIGVNRERREARNVMFVHTLYEPEDLYFGFHGDWLDWEEMRQFAIDQRTVWLTRYQGGRFELTYVGSIRAGEQVPSRQPLVRFEGGPAIEAASVREVGERRWAIDLTWLADGPVEGDIFLHVIDEQGNLAAQADGPALGGMVPAGLWQAGDRIDDVRYVSLAQGGGPYRVLAGVYNAEGRFAAFVDGARCPDDAAPVATLGR